LKIKSILIVVFSLLLFYTGCNTQRPVLYPNKHLLKVGKQQAEKDIDNAMSTAEKYDLDSSDYADGAKHTAGASLAGAAAGTAVKAIDGKDIWKGSVTGAVGGASGSVFNWAFSPSKPSPVFKRFVEQSLKEKGYQPIGWK
jgi:hypothetical protein